jgi:hypothetical protein
MISPMKRQRGASARSRVLHSLTKLPLPIVILRIAQPEGEHGIGQLAALPVVGMYPDQYGSVVATLNVQRVELRGVHGVILMGGVSSGRILPKTAT